MIFAKGFLLRRLTATSYSAIRLITRCLPDNTPPMASQPFHSLSGRRFLHDLARSAFTTLKPGGYFALLLAAQTEKDLPAGFGYLDHAFLGYSAALQAGFEPERRISCPMPGAYLPEQVRRARREGRLLGQVRDLLVLRKPLHAREISLASILIMESLLDCKGMQIAYPQTESVLRTLIKPTDQSRP